MSASQKDDFFIGYLGRLPAALRGPIYLAAVGLLAGFVGGAFAFSAGQPDPGDGGLAGGAMVSGVMRADPYPHIRTAPNDRQPNGGARLVVTQIKRGVETRARELDGQFVKAPGVFARRGSIAMLQVQGGGRIQPQADASAHETPVEPLGRWRIAGEICDGKCYLGVMRPGRGLAHKACANMCLLGGIPPVLVTEQPVEGETFILLADQDGKALGETLYDLVAVLVRLEGELERHGDMLVLKTDLAKAERL